MVRFGARRQVTKVNIIKYSQFDIKFPIERCKCFWHWTQNCFSAYVVDL